jgi:hypothetical protein
MIVVDMEYVQVSMDRKGAVHVTMDTSVMTVLSCSMGVGRTTALSMKMGVYVSARNNSWLLIIRNTMLRMVRKDSAFAMKAGMEASANIKLKWCLNGQIRRWKWGLGKNLYK